MLSVSSPPDIEALRVYLLLPLYHEFTNAQNYLELHTLFGRSFLGMIEIARKVVLHWWASMSVGYFEKLVENFRNVVSFILNHELQKINVGRSPQRGLINFNIHLKTALDLLKDLFHMNRFDREDPIPYETFYVQGLADSVHLQLDFCDFMSEKVYIGPNA